MEFFGSDELFSRGSKDKFLQLTNFTNKYDMFIYKYSTSFFSTWKPSWLLND